VRNDDLPAGIDGIDELLEVLVERAGVDGLFTDHPDRVVEFLKRRVDR
jgi:glycerophosphoryl diester phosphodiesterase